MQISNGNPSDPSGEADARAQLELLQRLVVVGTFEASIRNGAVKRIAGDYRHLHGLPDGPDETYAAWLNRLHADDRARAQAALQSAIDGKDDVYEDEYRIVRADDATTRWMRVRANIHRDGKGHATRIVGVQLDVTAEKEYADQVQARSALTELGQELEARVEERTRELQTALDSLSREVQHRERAEERLRQSEKLKAIGQLTGGIAHDFNNMLQTVSGSLGVIGLLVQQGRMREVDTYLDKARRGVSRAAALTHRLLAFGRKQTLAPQPLSLDDIVTGMEDVIQRTVGPEISVELKLCDGQWLVMCDGNQMESALLNLCVNARDAMPNGGWLTVTTQEVVLGESDIVNEEGAAPGRFASVAVTDTGVGMDSEVLARAIEPFFTTKPEGRGTGLGLSQIYGFVRQSGGFVRIESSPGGGTTVRIYLPYFSTRITEAERALPEPTVLFVEDEPDVRQITMEQFRAADFRVIEASNAEAAMRLVQSGTHFDVLVSDVRLPGGDGVQLAEAVRQLRPGLPILLISGYADGRTLPGIPLIDKPFEFSVLLDRVRDLLVEAGKVAPDPSR